MRYLTVVLAWLLAASPLSAFAQDFAGQWQCQMTYTELDQWGNRTSGHTREFAMALYANGGYEVQGVMAAANGYQQFFSTGQWLSDGTMVRLDGMEQQPNNPYYPPGMQFFFMGQLQQDGSLMFRYEMPDPGQRYVMNRTLAQCGRN